MYLIEKPVSWFALIASQLTGFYMMRNIGRSWVKKIRNLALASLQTDNKNVQPQTHILH